MSRQVTNNTSIPNALYDRKLLIYLFIALGVLWLLPIPAAPIYIGLAMYALLGPRQTIEAIALMFLLLLGNGAVLPGGSKALRWVVLFAGFARVVVDLFAAGNLRFANRQLNILLLFFLIMLPVTWASSKIMTISLFKLISFFAGTVTIVSSFVRTAHLRAYWLRWFTTYFVFIIGASTLVFLAGMGYERNGVGFQGIFSHPQVLGPVIGTVAAWLWGLYLIRGERSWFVLISSLLSLFFLYISQARTGALALVAGFVLAYLLFVLRGKSIYLDTRSRYVLALFSLLFLFYGVLQPEQIGDLIIQFAQKRTEGADLSGLVQESRGALIQNSLDNFQRHPIFGIGLGVPSDYEYGGFGTQETFLGLPVSASVEKGFMPTAVLEEMGIVGAIFTLVLFLTFVISVIRGRSFIMLWFLLGVFLINIGEAVLYSIGGTGLYVWLMMGLAFNQSQMPVSSRR